MTYNIRNARGLDGQVDLARIGAVIAAAAPDVVALQEVDVGRARSGAVDQATALAEQLGMTATFATCIEAGTERYGIATLTRLPLVDSTQVTLPVLPGRRRSEPRRALVTRHDWHGARLEIVNTHLSIVPGERPAQIATLVEGLAAERLILMGDLNCTRWSRTYRRLQRALRSAIDATHARTWPSRWPLLALDHILVRGLAVVHARAWNDGPARVASDHLPLVAELS